MNTVRLKYAMRAYARKHGLEVPKGYTPSSPVWGKGAKTLAWRITGHAKKEQSTSPVAVQAILFPKTLGQRIAEVALSQVGVHEDPYGSNDGPQIRKYQRAGGIPHPENLPPDSKQWCGCFVSWCARTAGYHGKLPPAPAWVPSWATFRPVARRSLKPGDYVCLWGSGHIEVFISWRIRYVLANCVGGNTSPVGKNANGGMVARTTRYVTEMNAAGRVG